MVTPAGEGERSAALVVGATIFAIVVTCCAFITLSSRAVTDDSGALRNRLPDVETVSGTLEREARAVLEPDADLGEARFVIVGSKDGSTSKASAQDGMFVEFGHEGTHRWKLFVQQRAEPAGACRPGSPSVLSCEVDKDRNGSLVVRSVIAAIRAPAEFGPGRYVLASLKSLETAELADVRIERHVSAYHSDGSVTAVSETVFAPKSLDPDLAFQSPPSQMARLVADPDVMRTVRSP